jgi:endonuclease/exonuclease/phosphatase (EEP) superfamily protein YafD
VNGAPVVLYNTHPVHPFLLRDGQPFNPAPRAEEVDAILARAQADSGAVLIAGDFNTTDRTDTYRRIAARYTDTYREMGWGLGFTFPDLSHPNAVPSELHLARLPIPQVVRLDYIFHSRYLQAMAIRVWPDSGGSDHRPVLAQFSLLSP